MNPTWVEENGKRIFPITHNRAILGGLSYKAYNIDDAVYGNNWNNVTDNGFYYDNNGYNRPPVGINNYSDKLLIEVIKINKGTILQKISMNNNELSDSNTSGTIKDVYSRTGVESEDGSVTWSSWYVSNTESLVSRTYVENTGSTATSRNITINSITSLEQLKDKVIFIKALNTGTSSVSTINVNNLGAKQIRINRNAGSSTSLISGWVRAGQVYSVSYDGTYFNLLSSGNREEPYLPLSGGTMSGTIINNSRLDGGIIKSNVDSINYTNGSKGIGSVINLTNTSSTYRVLFSGSSINGRFSFGLLQNAMYFVHQKQTDIDAGNETITSIYIDSNGNLIPGSNGTQKLGWSDKKWQYVYANTFYGALSGNASSATKLQTARTINGVAFDGTKNITIDVGGSGHTILNSSGIAMTQRSKLRFNNTTVIDDADNDVTIITPTGTTGNYLPLSGGKLTGNVTPTTTNSLSLGTSALKFNTMYATTFYGALSGNASTATTLATSRTINGTSFNGSANITTANWGTSRNIGIVNSDGTGTAVPVAVNGSSNVNLKLPATIKASLTGNASSATQAKVTDTSPATGTWYRIVFTSASGTSNTDLRINNNDIAVAIQEGTTSEVGFNILALGNGIESGTAGNKYGKLRLYSQSTGYDDIKGDSHAGAITHTLPSRSGKIINSTDSSVSNVVSMTTEDYNNNSSSLPNGTVAFIYDSEENYVTTQSSNITCDLPLDL